MTQEKAEAKRQSHRKGPFTSLISALVRLLKKRDEGVPSARATLARLASDARTGRSGRLFPFVVQHVSAPNNPQLEDDALLLTELFAMRPSPDGTATLPQLLRDIGAGDEGSTELRFRTLLGSRREDLGLALRQVMARIDSSKNLNWADLAFTIHHWDQQPDLRKDRASRPIDVKRQWARRYYSTSYQLNKQDPDKDATDEA